MLLASEHSVLQMLMFSETLHDQYFERTRPSMCILRNYVALPLHLHNISKITNKESQSDAEELVHLFFTSRLNFYDSLLSGCPKNSLKLLQLIENTAVSRCGLDRDLF